MKNWLLTKLKEPSTHYGLVLLAVAAGALLSAEQLGDVEARIATVSGLLATLRLVLMREAAPAVAATAEEAADVAEAAGEVFDQAAETAAAVSGLVAAVRPLTQHAAKRD